MDCISLFERWFDDCELAFVGLYVDETRWKTNETDGTRRDKGDEEEKRGKERELHFIVERLGSSS